MAVQESLTSIRVSWSPPTPLGDTTGYRIYYSGGSSGSEDVSDGSTNNSLLTGLQNGESYTIMIVGTSQHLPSARVAVNMEVGLGEDLYMCSVVHLYMYIEKSGDKKALRTAVSSLLALISAVQYNLLWDPHGFIYPRFS